MNYELAKRLKDAGFPQNPNDHNESPNSWFDKDGDLLDFVSDLEADVYNPTLSELITACGRCFGGLQPWDALNYPFKKWRVDRRESGIGIFLFYGSTPEETVANLWLALNKK